MSPATDLWLRLACLSFVSYHVGRAVVAVLQAVAQ